MFILYTILHLMTLVAHSLIAVAIASKYNNPLVGLPLVLISHFVVDKIPHWDVMTNKNKTHRQIAFGTFIDIFSGFFLAGIFNIFFLNSAVNPMYFLISIALCQFPDLFEAPHRIFNIYIPGSEIDYKFQKWIHDVGFDSRLCAPWGIVTQFLTVAIFLFWSLT